MKTKLGCALALIGALHFAPSAQASEGDRFNVRINPLAFLIGVFNVDFDIGLSDRITVGPSLAYFNYGLGTSSSSGGKIGVRANFFLSSNKFTDGWYAGPVVNYSFASFEDSSAKDTYGIFSIGSLFGYSWFWDSGFNMMLGLGVQYVNSPDTLTIAGVTYDAPGYSGVAPAFEWSMGISF